MDVPEHLRMKGAIMVVGVMGDTRNGIVHGLLWRSVPDASALPANDAYFFGPLAA